MDEIAKPTPRVFTANVSNALASKATFYFVVALFGSVELGLLLYRFVFHSSIVLAGPITLTCAVLIIWRIKARGNTKARIEVCGNDISSFDDQGNLIVTENMREIAIVNRSCWSSSNSLTNEYSVDYFQVLFKSGAIITFHEQYEDHYILLKILHVRTGVDPLRVPWTDYQKLELQTLEDRVQRVSELKALT